MTKTVKNTEPAQKNRKEITENHALKFPEAWTNQNNLATGSKSHRSLVLAGYSIIQSGQIAEA
jgi:hypothetical protein